MQKRWLSVLCASRLKKAAVHFYNASIANKQKSEKHNVHESNLVFPPSAMCCLRLLWIESRRLMKVFFSSFSYSSSSRTPRSFTSSSDKSLTKISMSDKIWVNSLVERSSNLRPEDDKKWISRKSIKKLFQPHFKTVFQNWFGWLILQVKSEEGNIT